MDKSIDTTMLQVLIALSQNETVSKAAQELNVTQSAVSQSLKSLESKLKIPIIHRHGKAVTLTQNGRRLAKVAKMYFKRIDETLDQIHQESGTLKGTIHLGTLAGLGKSWLAEALILFCKDYPDLNIRISIDFPENLIKLFELGDIDVLVLPHYQMPPWANTQELHEEYSNLIFPNQKDYTLNAESELKDLLQYPVLMFEANDPLFYRWVKGRFKATPKLIKTRITVNSFDQIIQAVSQGLGVAVVPTHVLRKGGSQNDILVLPEECQVFNNKISFATLSEDSDQLKIKTLYASLNSFLKNSDLV